MWRELISDLTSHPTRNDQPIGDVLPGPDFSPGATPGELEMVERALGVRPPESPAGPLCESNGVRVTFGTPLVWGTDQIVRHNRELREDLRYRETWMPFDHLLFFGGAGVDGILFAFAIIGGGIDRDRVYAWYPIEDNRELKAESLRGYVEGWLGGRLTV